MVLRYQDAEELEYMTIRKLLLGYWDGWQNSKKKFVKYCHAIFL